MTDLADRIRARLKALNMTQASIARDAGLKPDYIRDVLRRHKKSISVEHAAKLARILQCELNWLISGDIEGLSSEDVASGLSVEPTSENNSISTIKNFKSEILGSVPEVDARAGAGNGSVGDHEVVQLERGGTYVGHRVVSEWVFPPTFLRHELHVQPGGVMVLEVVGDSMSPTIESGDRVIIDTGYSNPTPDGIYVIDEGYGPMVKRIQIIRRSDPPEIRIISDNKNHETYTLRLDDVRIIGRVSGRVTKM